MTTPSRSVLITGCSSGIGEYVAQQLQQDFHVIASARNPADVERLQALGLDAVQLDLADSASIAAAVSTVHTLCNGKLYGLFNNAGFGLPGAVEDIPREGLRAQFETNVFGPMELINHVLPWMREQQEGRIIQHSSVLGLCAFPFRGAYSGSKFALEGLSDTLRMELKGSGVHVSLIEPGPISSKFRDNAFLAYQRYVDRDKSVFRDKYTAMEARLKTPGPAAPFTESPDSVYRRVLHSLQSPKPKVRYYVTPPTYAFAILKRLLPFRLLDRVLIKASGDGKR